MELCGFAFEVILFNKTEFADITSRTLFRLLDYSKWVSVPHKSCRSGTLGNTFTFDNSLSRVPDDSKLDIYICILIHMPRLHVSQILCLVHLPSILSFFFSFSSIHSSNIVSSTRNDSSYSVPCTVTTLVSFLSLLSSSYISLGKWSTIQGALKEWDPIGSQTRDFWVFSHSEYTHFISNCKSDQLELPMKHLQLLVVKCSFISTPLPMS